MDDLAKNLKHYLSEVTGLKVVVEPMAIGELSYSFSHRYALYELSMGNTTFFAVFLREEAEFKPAQFIKHIRQLPMMEEGEFCVVARSIPAYVRKRLIEKRIAFVIPEVQMYLPTLGMALREREKGKSSNFAERYSPASQVVLICFLLGRIEGTVTPLELSKRLGYSAMTMSRVLDELEATGVASVERIGRSRLATFPEDRNTVWHKVRPKLRNPVKRTHHISENGLSRQKVLCAGNTALSAKTGLGEPVYPEYALSRHEWNTMKHSMVETIPIEEPGSCVLQVWCYDPKLLEVEGCVDPFSLYLSLQDTNDERIEMALEELMEQYL